MREEILSWLKDGCDTRRGIALYFRYGNNELFKKALITSPSKAQRRLKHLLCSFAGVSITNYSSSVLTIEQDRFRKMYPFLSDINIPSELKILATDKMTTTGMWSDYMISFLCVIQIKNVY